MNLEQKITDALVVKAEEPPLRVDLEAVRRAGRRRRRWRTGISAMTVAGLVGAIIAVTVAVTGPSDTAGPANVGRLDFGDGVRAFVDHAAGNVEVGGRAIPTTTVPGLAETGLATPMGILYITPDQEVRLLEEPGKQTVLAGPEGKAPRGFHPSIGFDAAEGATVWLTSAGRKGPVVTVLDLGTRTVLRKNPLHPFCSVCRSMILGGSDHGLVVVRLRMSEGSWAGTSWYWKECLDDECPRTTGPGFSTEWHEFLPSGQELIDLQNRVMMIDRDPASLSEELAPWGIRGAEHVRWTFVPGPAGSELSPTGSERLARSGPTSVLGGGPIALDIPRGSTPYASYDSDGSVLVSTSKRQRDSRTVTSVYDCTQARQTCTPIGEVEAEGPVVLAGRGSPMQ